MADGVIVIRDLAAARRYAANTPLSADRIDEAARAVRDEGSKAWNWIEPLAGLLFPRVKVAINQRLADWDQEATHA